jgi:hypothetical protein
MFELVLTREAGYHYFLIVHSLSIFCHYGETLFRKPSACSELGSAEGFHGYEF